MSEQFSAKLVSEGQAPLVSIILPTYNRAAFLPEAFAAIREQHFADWELIVVDDGSTDDSAAVIEQEFATIEQPKTYVRQENQGAYGARNTGLRHARGKYVAFYDSDDLWLPHHLADCSAALEANPGVDWVYGSVAIVAGLGCENIVEPNIFCTKEGEAPFLKLRTRVTDNLHIITDDAAAQCMIIHGINAGLQHSLIRNSVFDKYTFCVDPKNEAEDQLAVVHALLAGHRFAYFKDVHLLYRLHSSNSSAAGEVVEYDRQLRVLKEMIDGYERLSRCASLSQDIRRALRKRVSRDLFWSLGYSTLWENGKKAEAIQAYQRGLRMWPWNPYFWKTYLLARLRKLS